MKSLDEGKRLRYETIYFDFRLNIDGTNLKHVNEFILVTKLMKENEIPEKLKSQSIQSKGWRKPKEIPARGLSSVFERSSLKFVLLLLNFFFSLEILMLSEDSGISGKSPSILFH